MPTKTPLSENSEIPIHSSLQLSSIPAGRLQYSRYRLAMWGYLEVQLFRCLGFNRYKNIKINFYSYFSIKPKYLNF